MSENEGRRDELGRAFAGSQMQTQLYVARRPKELSGSVKAALRDAGFPRETVRWVAPLEKERFVEPSDAGFLQALGLGHLSGELAKFWPSGGRCGMRWQCSVPMLVGMASFWWRRRATRRKSMALAARQNLSSRYR